MRLEFRKFLATIDKTVPEGLDIHVICDNYGTHKTPAIKAWLARHPRVHMHFTPTGSSWINQVERWFGFLTDQMIRRGAHKSVQALEKDIRAWVEGWNADPKPFVWKKTAEEILDSLARYLQRISGAGHGAGQGGIPVSPAVWREIKQVPDRAEEVDPALAPVVGQLRALSFLFNLRVRVVP